MVVYQISQLVKQKHQEKYKKKEHSTEACAVIIG